MEAWKTYLSCVACFLLGFMATLSLAQSVPNAFSAAEMGVGAKLVVTSVFGPTTAIHNQTISVTYIVENQSEVASNAYQVDLYLSTDKNINPATERLLKNVAFSEGLAPGETKKATAKVLVPVNGLSGKYYCVFPARVHETGGGLGV